MQTGVVILQYPMQPRVVTVAINSKKTAQYCSFNAPSPNISGESPWLKATIDLLLGLGILAMCIQLLLRNTWNVYLLLICDLYG